jgi:dephospho-CoA kinase
MGKWKEQRLKPVIGLAGGIGSGKSAVAGMFAGLGCFVFDADRVAHEVLQSDPVKAALREWMGEGIFNPDGTVHRKAVARVVFSDAASTERLEGLIHPRVRAMRDEMTGRAMADEGVKAVLWDIPLLFETGQGEECDAVVFVKVPRDVQLRRLKENRGWTEEELMKREKLQFSLDKKADLADYYVDNSGDLATTLRQVESIFLQILAKNG